MAECNPTIVLFHNTSSKELENALTLMLLSSNTANHVLSSFLLLFIYCFFFISHISTQERLPNRSAVCRGSIFVILHQVYHTVLQKVMVTQ